MDEHDRRLKETLKLIEKPVIKLETVKYEFRKIIIRYFGHIIPDKGIQPSKEKIEAISKLPSSSVAKFLRNNTIFSQICAEFSKTFKKR